MRFSLIIVGAIMLFSLTVPIYYTTGFCCGHSYDEGMTLVKIFLLGQDSCLVDSGTILQGWAFTIMFVLSFGFLVYGFGTSKVEEAVTHEE